MGLSPPVPDYSAKEISRRAEEFLGKYHPSLSLPVPIEEIIEFQFRIDIVPLHGLHRAFEIDGFISSDSNYHLCGCFRAGKSPWAIQIYARSRNWPCCPSPRFFPAACLHWNRRMERVRSIYFPRDYGTIEWQAYQFAGSILVPSKALRLKYNEAMELARNTGIVRGKRIEPPGQQYIASWLAKQFVVSSEVIERCIQRDKL